MSGSLSKTTSENASTDIRTEKSAVRGVNHVVVNGGKAVSERVAMSDKMQGTVSMKNYENQGKEIVVKPYTIANKTDGKAQVIQQFVLDMCWIVKTNLKAVKKTFGLW